MLHSTMDLVKAKALTIPLEVDGTSDSSFQWYFIMQGLLVLASTPKDYQAILEIPEGKFLIAHYLSQATGRELLSHSQTPVALRVWTQWIQERLDEKHYLAFKGLPDYTVGLANAIALDQSSETVCLDWPQRKALMDSVIAFFSMCARQEATGKMKRVHASFRLDMFFRYLMHALTVYVGDKEHVWHAIAVILQKRPGLLVWEHAETITPLLRELGKDLVASPIVIDGELPELWNDAVTIASAIGCSQNLTQVRQVCGASLISFLCVTLNRLAKMSATPHRKQMATKTALIIYNIAEALPTRDILNAYGESFVETAIAYLRGKKPEPSVQTTLLKTIQRIMPWNRSFRQQLRDLGGIQVLVDALFLVQGSDAKTFSETDYYGKREVVTVIHAIFWYVARMEQSIRQAIRSAVRAILAIPAGTKLPDLWENMLGARTTPASPVRQSGVCHTRLMMKTSLAYRVLSFDKQRSVDSDDEDIPTFSD